MTYYSIISSPVGDITLVTDGKALTGLHIEGDRYFTEIPSLWQKKVDHVLLKQTAEQVSEYFRGARRHFTIPVHFKGTEFQQAVWKALQAIPAGITVSYADIARKISRPNAVRAVGSAIGRNPVCIIVPCHRVLTSTGSFGGYVAGVACKRFLLGLEGVVL